MWPVLLYLLVFLGIAILLFRFLLRILLPLFLLVVVGALVMTALAPRGLRRREDGEDAVGPRGSGSSFPDYENRGPVIDVRSETVPDPEDDPSSGPGRK